MVDYINEKCGTFRNVHGQVNVIGQRVAQLENNLFRVHHPFMHVERRSVQNLTAVQFFNEYVARNKPVIFTDATQVRADGVEEEI